MEPDEKKTQELGLAERLRKSWLAPAAALGAIGISVAASLRERPEQKTQTPAPKPESAPRPEGSDRGDVTPAAAFQREYVRSVTLSGKGSTSLFQRSLAGIAVGPGDSVYVLGDDEVRIHEPGGALVKTWKAPGKSTCIAVGPDRRVYLGLPGRVEILDDSGMRIGGFAVGESSKPADITAIKIYRKELLVADAAARIIRRLDSTGKQVGTIGDRSKAGSFILPNKSLDLDVDPKGIVRATDTGRHQVTAWSMDGSPLGSFGKFGMTDPADFVGCCNPVDLAVAPDGMIVTGEKMVARVKVYEPGGRLLAVIGPQNFDPQCTKIHLAVDSKGRIITADPVRRTVVIYSQVARTGAAGRSESI